MQRHHRHPTINNFLLNNSFSLLRFHEIFQFSRSLLRFLLHSRRVGRVKVPATTMAVEKESTSVPLSSSGQRDIDEVGEGGGDPEDPVKARPPALSPQFLLSPGPFAAP
ncbi:uncharacterized protein J3R85_002734 [Psidium guajava]|nr:uncharacterized protein J3R85_002734 [Psidium guajava]